jgi:hypothetical protein
MTDWIKHTTDNCPVDPETVVEVRLRGGYVRPADKAGDMDWGSFWLASARPPLGSPIQHPLDVTHYRIITPAEPLKPTGVLRREINEDPADWERAPYAENAKPPEPEMVHSYPDDAESYAQSQVRPEMNADAAAALKRRIADAYRAGEDAQVLKAKARALPEPDLITLRLECLKLAVNDHFYEAGEPDYEKVADRFLHYVLNGSVDKAP